MDGDSWGGVIIIQCILRLMVVMVRVIKFIKKDYIKFSFSGLVSQIFAGVASFPWGLWLSEVQAAPSSSRH